MLRCRPPRHLERASQRRLGGDSVTDSHVGRRTIALHQRHRCVQDLDLAQRLLVGLEPGGPVGFERRAEIGKTAAAVRDPMDQLTAALGLGGRPRTAGRRDAVECVEGPVVVVDRSGDPGQAEAGRGRERSIGAGTHRVQAAGDLVLTGAFAGDGERKLRGQLAGDLAVDRVERGDRVGHPPLGEGPEPDQPHGAPAPRIVGEDGGRGLVEHVGVARLEPGVGERLPNPRRRLRRGAQHIDQADRIGDGDAGDPRGHRIVGVGAQPWQVVPRRHLGRRARGLEQRGRARPRCGAGPGRGERDDLAQHTDQLVAELVGRLEPILGVGRHALHEQSVEGVVLDEHRRRLLGRHRRQILLLVALELEHQHRQRADDGEQIGRDRAPVTRHLGSLIADRAVDGRQVVVDAAHPAQVDELDGVGHLDQVGRLEVAEQQAGGVEIRERRQHLDHERDGLVGR